MSYLFRSTMKKYYPRQKLSSLVKVEVNSDNSGVTVNCSELPYADASIIVSNLSPFHITVHDIEAELYLSGRVARFVKICNVDVSPSGKEILLLQTDLTVKQVDYIKKNKNADNPKLKIKMLLNCNLSSFEINNREISVKSINFLDCDRHSWKFISRSKSK